MIVFFLGSRKKITAEEKKREGFGGITDLEVFMNRHPQKPKQSIRQGEGYMTSDRAHKLHQVTEDLVLDD